MARRTPGSSRLAARAGRGTIPDLGQIRVDGDASNIAWTVACFAGLSFVQVLPEPRLRLVSTCKPQRNHIASGMPNEPDSDLRDRRAVHQGIARVALPLGVIADALEVAATGVGEPGPVI